MEKLNYKEEYQMEKSEVLKNLRGIKNPNTVKIYAGVDVYSITDCIKEVEDDTDFGIEQVVMSIKAKKLIKEILNIL